MLLEHVGIIHADGMTEDDRVRDLHHRGLHVQREQQTPVPGVVNLAGQELAECRPAHHRRVDHLTLLQCEAVLENRGFPRRILHHDLHRAGGRHHVRLLAAEEVSFAHVCHVRLHVAGPLTHRMRIGLGVGLDRRRHTTIRIPLSQHGVDRTAQHPGIPCLDRLFGLTLRFLGIFGHVVPVILQFLDGGLQLRNRCADIWQLDDVGCRSLGQLTQFGQCVILLLFVCEILWEIGNDPASQGNILQVERDP